MIEFLLNGQAVAESDLDPDLTILRYLRTKKGSMGTKEGCASGDCGACTVMVGELLDTPDGRRVDYQAVNSCIALVGSLQGKHLVTVEGLAARGGDLHPVQRAMVDNHGSQCGFCTPGIVMSLAALHESAAQNNLDNVLEALSGNLCRCTGYRPIVDAGLNCSDYPRVENAIHRAGQAAAHWPGRVAGGTPAVQSPLGTCVYPQNERDLQRCIQTMPGARLIAGGTDLLLEVTQLYRRLPQLIGLGDVAELKTHAVTGNAISLGGALSYSAACAVLSEPMPEVAALIHRLGSRQIRNRGTLGGNLANASPIADIPPILLALDAELELSTTNSMRRVAVEDFYLDYKKTLLEPGEYIRRIIIPRPAANDFFKCYKVSKRFEDDISAVMLALRWRLERGVITAVRLGYGGMAAIPKRAVRAEAALLGQPLAAAAIDNAATALAADFSPLSDVRASSDYRLRVAGRLLHKAFMACSAPAVATDMLDPRHYQSPARAATRYWPQ